MNVTIGFGARLSFGVVTFTVGGDRSPFSGFVVFRVGADFVVGFSQPRRVRTSSSGQGAAVVVCFAHLPSRSVSPLGHSQVLLDPGTRGGWQRAAGGGGCVGGAHLPSRSVPPPGHTQVLPGPGT